MRATIATPVRALRAPRHGLWTSVLFGLALSAIAPASPSAAQEEEETAEEQAAEEGHGHEAFYRTPTFWAAVINFALLLLVLRRLGARPLATYLVDRRRVM